MTARSLALGVALLVAACTGAAPPSASQPQIAAITVPLCSEVPQIAAPESAYRDSPVYVGNEMPIDAVLAWARGRPHFQSIWIDREHNGWITVAFSADAAARQAEIDEEFNDAGVVAVEVDWTKAELEDLQRRVHQELPFVGYSGILETAGVVTIGVGVLSADRLAAVEAAFGGDRVCVEGTPAAEAPPPGPQPLGGDGWRLVGDERTGEPYRTGLAFDAASLAALWHEARMAGAIPEVDFEREVVIWFGAVYGSSCPNIRLDDVVVHADPHAEGLVHAKIVLVDSPGTCTADANGRAYIVAVERGRLPGPPFRIQLSADDPPGVALHARTMVEADLRVPGAVAGPGEVRREEPAPQPEPLVEPGGFVETGFPMQFRLPVPCGIEWLGELNGVQWRTSVPTGAKDFVPPEWEPLVGEEAIVVSVLLSEGPAPMLVATANGHSVEYLPESERPPDCD